jgi:hypothetical protein
MNPYLLSLVSGPRYSSFGVDEPAYSFRSLRPDPEVQPARLYSLFSVGGGVTFDENAAKAIRGSGFAVVGDNLDAAEKAYLQHVQPGKWDDVTYAWFWECTGTRSTTEIACNHPEGVTTQVLPVSEARSTAIVSAADLRPAEDVAGKGKVGTVVVGAGTGLWTWEEFGKAIQTVRAWYGIRRSLEVIHLAKKGGVALPRRTAGVEAKALRILAKYAQPVAGIVKEYPQYEERFGAEEDEFGIAHAVWLYSIGLTVFVGLTLRSMVKMTAGGAVETQAMNLELVTLTTEITGPLRDCITDPSKGWFEKRACRKALESERKAQTAALGTPAVEGIADTAGAIMGLMIAGAAIYLGAPIVKGFAEGAKDRMDERRERRVAEKQAAAQQQVVAQQFPALELVEEDEIA